MKIEEQIYQHLIIGSIAIALFGGLLLWRELLGNAPIPGIYSYMYLSSASFSMRLISIAVSLASVILVLRLLNIQANDKYRLIAAIMFIIAPSTIVLSAVFSPYSAALFLVLLCLNLLHTRIKIVATIPMIATAFFDWISFLCSIILCASYMIYNDKRDICESINGCEFTASAV